MKKLLLILFVSNFAFSQPSVEIRLVDYNIGSPIYVWDEFYIHSLNTSNDAGLNAIFTTYGITNYENNEVHPYGPYAGRIKNIRGNVSQQFIDALTAYSSVIESVHITNGMEFTDALRLQLADLTIGSPVGTSGGVIVTNDPGLNAIFQTYNVFFYTQSYPSSTVNNILRYYTVVCNCDKNLLNAALSSYSTVVSTTELYNGGVMLSNPQFEKSKAIISPNPFSDIFDIETKQTIINYSITDITGKTIASTSSKSDLDNQSSQLSAGMYILNLSFDNGQTANYKLIKK
ncbi:T9SS type A sorting domain-containing protein [Flavobacterium sangjuense]|uniref:Secretion system C-terminal sorting domain-containing protein n=1 Tax=Flavobacterium sangjuense TaxID=2518177 RepID=A0A4P7PY29_9FLAO|nr:T9SS type A sorting domain-containing protein [Flavobacterium sangjuense]QBZ99023.1 hypothetical protein GS03_02538 [Flavobacterium sangjuense]